MPKLVILTLAEEVIYCNSAHYISGHKHCGCVHGHTYYIKNFAIEVDYDVLNDGDTPLPFFDFGYLKKFIKDLFDHRFIVPEKDAAFWRNVYLRAIESGIKLRNVENILPIPYDIATCENMGEYLKSRLLNLPGVVNVTFELREGPQQGVLV